jgi:hypothetical protein
VEQIGSQLAMSLPRDELRRTLHAVTSSSA